MEATPVALFTYNRPEHARRALSSLGLNPHLGDCPLYIYCDGPKNPDGQAAVTANRQAVQEAAASLKAAYPGIQVEIIDQDENLGLARSIVAGVSELCSRHGRVIVLEDDLVVSPDFLSYMLQALDRYRDESNVMQVSGYMFPIQNPPAPDALFLPVSTTWGWATWERAWRSFDWNAAGAVEGLRDASIRRRFNLDNSYHYASILQSRLAGRNDSWGILWWWSVFMHDGLVLYPRQSLVWNGGFDNTGTHTGASPRTMQLPREEFDQPRLPGPIRFPVEISIDELAFQRVKAYLRRLQGPLPVRLARQARRSLGEWLKRSKSPAGKG